MSAAGPTWLGPTLRRYTGALAVATAALAVSLWALGAPPFGAQAVVMAACVALLALPHGAFDLEVARRVLGARGGSLWWVPFSSVYVAAAGGAALLWWASPATGLALLLGVGALHWGDEDVEARARSGLERAWLAGSRGAVPVALPCLAHPERVAEIFALLGLESASGAGVARAAGVATALAAPGVIYGIVRAAAARPGERSARWLPAVEVGALAALMFAAPPLLAFTVYFCFWHSARHSLRSAAELEPGSLGAALVRYAKATAAPTAITIVGGAAAAMALLKWTDASATPALVRVTFVGLFALTVPHVLLELALERTGAGHEGEGGSAPETA